MQVARAAAACVAVPHTGDMDLVQVRRSYKFRAYPTRPQESRAVRLLADHWALVKLLQRLEKLPPSGGRAVTPNRLGHGDDNRALLVPRVDAPVRVGDPGQRV